MLLTNLPAYTLGQVVLPAELKIGISWLENGDVEIASDDADLIRLIEDAILAAGIDPQAVADYIIQCQAREDAAALQQAIIDIAKGDFKVLPNWATWTGQQAAGALKAAILSGMTKAEARAAIDAQFADVTNLATAVAATIAVLKQLSDAVIDGRDVGHQNEARAIMYLRDIVIEK